MDNIKFIIPGKPEYLTMVRLAISSIATTAGFDLEAVEDMKTAVSEACKNISCHGYSGFADKYDVECNVGQGMIEITVRDDCDSHSIAKTHKPCEMCPSEGDLGIYVIESLMNKVEFGRGEDERKFIRMVKKV